MGGVHAPKSFVLWSNCTGAFLGNDPSVIVPWKKQQFPPKRVPQRLSCFFEVGQGLSCFCSEIFIGGDDYSAFHLFGQILDGLFELGSVRGSEIEHARAKFHSLVHEQWQLELSGNRSRVLINNVFAFSTSLASVLGGICTKLVIWCFKIISMFSWFNTCAVLRLFSWQH